MGHTQQSVLAIDTRYLFLATEFSDTHNLGPGTMEERYIYRPVRGARRTVFSIHISFFVLNIYLGYFNLKVGLGLLVELFLF